VSVAPNLQVCSCLTRPALPAALPSTWAGLNPLNPSLLDGTQEVEEEPVDLRIPREAWMAPELLIFNSDPMSLPARVS